MNNTLKPVRVGVWIDELSVADGAVDSDSVRVYVRWRAPEGGSPFGSAISELTPRHPGSRLRMQDLDDLVPLKLTDGRGTLIPARWRSLRLGGGTPFAELCRRNYEACLSPTEEGVEDHILGAVERARFYIRSYQPNFDDYPAEKQADFLRRTLKKMIAIVDQYEDLERHLEHATPDKGKAVPPIEDPGRAVRAAILAEIHNLKTRKIGEELGFKRYKKLDVPGTRRYYDGAVGIAIDYGLSLLEQAFGSGGWEPRKERIRRMRGWRTRCEKLGRAGEYETEEFYELLAEARGTTSKQERASAIADGFDEKLHAWDNAVDDEERKIAFRAVRDDPRSRLSAVLHLLDLLGT